MNSPHLVVVGASLAGLRAVEAARKAGHTGRITLVGAEPHLPYDRPPLSKAFLDDSELPDVAFREERHLREDLDVALELGCPASGLDTEHRTVEIGDRELNFDTLVIATGAHARRLPAADGIDGVHLLRTLDDARAVRASLEAGAETVVVGSGFIGSEVASAVRRRGLPVTIVEAAPTPLVRAIGEQMGGALAELHHREGTDLRCGVSVTGLGTDHGGRVTTVQLSDGSKVRTDLVVAGIGADPATTWLQDSQLGIDNGVVADSTLRALDTTGRPVPGVYVAGDVARWHNPLFDRTMRIEHWTSAAEQGAAAARNALDPEAAKPYSTVPYFWSDWYGQRIQFVGLTVADEVRVVSGAPDTDRFVALYRTGDRLGGALTLNGQSVIMKYRNQIAKGGSWDDALAFADKRNATEPA
ncbi:MULTISPECIES: FAD-dependent oxidoreductase [unclassified Pseudonocardia]|uniref:NAD(P)/FAD-dependent oxidoreductase n=1 Tax=unclassified Pseudonocardia TaxID=2619320 RepID=UPI0001FFE9D0|nr:FAD-dependent oxidoreductase [Pseudonocardia sp. Ae707_Ps1]OLM09024.1 Ferredoxin reductase [Pseudonocardia sp. Ae707_Ps1]